MLHGSGANGKTTFLETLRYVFGGYAQTAEFSTFTASRSIGGPRNDLAKLRGARLVVASEGEAENPLAESLVKQVTGGDTVTARYLYSEHFEFKPQFKLWLATNHLPVIRGTDDGIWRRIRRIPFDIQILPNEQDRQLGTKLIDEAAGILRWAIIGFADYLNNGLQQPDRVTLATETYREDQDVFKGFPEDCYVLAPDARANAHELYLAYKTYAEQRGGRVMSERQFSRTLASRSLVSEKKSFGRLWFGIG